MNSIKEKIVKLLLPVLVGMVVDTLMKMGPEKAKEFADKILDLGESLIEKSETQVDDALLPIIGAIRTAFDIPDND